jgi:hypothetical protein
MATQIRLTFSEIEKKLNNWEYDPHQGRLTIRTRDGETYQYRNTNIRELRGQIPTDAPGEPGGFRQFLQSRFALSTVESL